MQREVQADSEHQQDDADFRELKGQALISDVSGGKGPDYDARENVSDKERDFQTVRDSAENERQTKADDDRCDKWLVDHCPPCSDFFGFEASAFTRHPKIQQCGSLPSRTL